MKNNFSININTALVVIRLGDQLSLDSGISSCHETQGSVVVIRLGDL